MLMNKKGAALLQVLLMAAILAGIATMLLRASLSRSTSARKTRRTVSAEMLIQSCMAEVNALWSAKTEEQFQRDLEGHYMYCANETGESVTGASCAIDKRVQTYVCQETDPYDGSPKYQVTATMDESGQITYEITQGADTL